MASPFFSPMSLRFEVSFGLLSSCGESVYHCCVVQTLFLLKFIGGVVVTIIFRPLVETFPLLVRI